MNTTKFSPNFQIYAVGGAVRDKLLHRQPKDHDWVIVHATEADVKELQAQGFTQVGVDFPVFLHPKTGDEYALARTERKSGAGYKGFSVISGININPELLTKFKELGFEEGKHYPVEELVAAFRRINQ